MLHKTEAVEIGAVLKEISTLILPKEIWTDTSPIAQPGDLNKLWSAYLRQAVTLRFSSNTEQKTNNKAHFFPLG